MSELSIYCIMYSCVRFKAEVVLSPLTFGLDIKIDDLFISKQNIMALRRRLISLLFL